MSIGGDDAGIRDEESGPGAVRTFEKKYGRFCARDDVFERQFGTGRRGSCSGAGGADFSGESLRDGIELHVKAICFEEKIFAVFVAVERDPFHGAFGQRNFFCGVAREIEARDKWMFETRTNRSMRAVKVAAGIVFFKWGGADDDAVDLDGGAGRRAGDGEFFSGYTGSEEKEECADNERAGAHGDDPGGVYYRNR